MSESNKTIERLKVDILDTERILDLVKGHPIMEDNYKHKLNDLKEQLKSEKNLKRRLLNE